MSCSCNCNPCTCEVGNCRSVPCVIQLPETEPVAYSFENANLTGVGVLHAVDGTLVQFRGIVSTSPALNITLDSPNAVINIDFDGSLLIAEIPTASETERGIAEVATQAETNAGIVDNVIVTPAKLAARTATETRTGILEIATQAEVTTGTDDTRAVTPLKLATFAAGQFVTRTFADAVARGGATPAFIGQFGGQQDNATAWMAYGTTVADWSQIPTTDADFQVTDSFAAQWSVTTPWTIDGSGGGTLVIQSFTSVTFDSNTDVFFSNGDLQFATNVDFDGVTRIFDGGVIVPANSVLTTSSTAGQFNSALQSTFISTANVQTGYTNFANPAVLRTCDTATVTLPQLAQLVGTLINDLKAVLLPAT